MLSIVDFVELESKEKVELFELNKFEKPKNILIIGTFHGEEPQGFMAINKYLKEFDPDKKTKNHIYFIPCFNPDGKNLNQRGNINKVDLNRNFPTKNWRLTEKESDYYGGNEPASETETKFMVKILEKLKPSLILSLHSPFGVVNFDGDGQNISKKIADFMKYPVQEDIGYPTPGSFGTYCGVERKIPTITLEYSENEDFEIIYEKSKKVFDYLLYEFDF